MRHSGRTRSSASPTPRPTASLPKLRDFRDRLALDSTSADPKAAAQLSRRAYTYRLMLDARLAALIVEDAETHLNELPSAIAQAGPNPHESTALLTRGWEAAGEATIADGILALALQATDQGQLELGQLYVDEVKPCLLRETNLPEVARWADGTVQVHECIAGRFRRPDPRNRR